MTPSFRLDRRHHLPLSTSDLPRSRRNAHLGSRARIAPKYPVGRLGQPEDVAWAALYLASDASGFMTGTDLLIDGGFTAQ